MLYDYYPIGILVLKLLLDLSSEGFLILQTVDSFLVICTVKRVEWHWTTNALEAFNCSLLEL